MVLQELDKIVVKGKREAVQIYTILAKERFDGEAAARAFAKRHSVFIRACRHRAWQQGRELLADSRRAS